MRERGLVTSFEFRVSSRESRPFLAPRNSQRIQFRVSSKISFLATRNSQLAPPSGITLIEILISLFVLLFGLMGVAAIFPVASHYLVQGDQKDRSDALANNAFAEIEARGLMNAKKWVYPTNNSVTNPPLPVITTPGTGIIGTFANPFDPGIAFVIDPLAAHDASINMNLRQNFPATLTPNVIPWTLNFPANTAIPGMTAMTVSSWPVRRVSFDVNPNSSAVRLMELSAAETIFRLRDDLAVEQPRQGDRPAMQRWSVDGATGTLLARQYIGDYSWLATVVPADNNALLGLQPAANLAGGTYDVSVVVFYKRDIVPSVSTSGSPGSERLIAAEFLNQGELVLYDATTSDDETLETALDGIRPTNWVCVMGVNQTSGQFQMKWYRILAIEEDFFNQDLPGAGNNINTRTLMVTDGGDWPSDSWQNLRVAILPGAIHVQTRQMQLSCECCE